MKLFLLVLANAALLLAVGRWLWAQSRLPGLGAWVMPALILRLLAGTVSTLYPSEDVKYYYHLSQDIAAQLGTAPERWWRLMGTDEVHPFGLNLVYHGFSNTLFFLKVGAVLNALTANSMLAIGLYLSLASWAACWVLVRTLSRLFPATQLAAVVGFLVWPSVVFWSSGITKESLLLAGSALVTAAVLELLYGRPRRQMIWGLLGLLGAWLSFKMRFFYGGALLALLLCLVVVRWGELVLAPLQRRRWQLLLFGLVLAVGTALAGEISPVFRFNKFASQLTRTYAELRERSLGRPHIELPELAPTAASILQHAPEAVGSTLFRPFIWEIDSALYCFAALENLLLLVLLIAAALDVVRGRRVPLPFAPALAMGLYCLSMAALIGLSTPNFGTLNRYRAPWLVLLVYLLCSHPTVAGWLKSLRVRLSRRRTNTMA